MGGWVPAPLLPYIYVHILYHTGKGRQSSKRGFTQEYHASHLRWVKSVKLCFYPQINGHWCLQAYQSCSFGLCFSVYFLLCASLRLLHPKMSSTYLIQHVHNITIKNEGLHQPCYFSCTRVIYHYQKSQECFQNRFFELPPRLLYSN